jgi:Domain of unknown function (DUF4407)
VALLVAQGVALSMFGEEVSASLAVKDQQAVDAGVKNYLVSDSGAVGLWMRSRADGTNEITNLRSQIVSTTDQLQREIEGDGSRTAGEGPIVRLKRQQLNELQTALANQEASLGNIDRSLAEAQKKLQLNEQLVRSRLEVRYAASHGLAAKLDVLSRTPRAMQLQLLLSGILTFFGLMPLLARWLIGETSYEFELTDENERILDTKTRGHLHLVPPPSTAVPVVDWVSLVEQS